MPQYQFIINFNTMTTSIFNNHNNFYDHPYAIKNNLNILKYAIVSIYQKFQYSGYFQYFLIILITPMIIFMPSKILLVFSTMPQYQLIKNSNTLTIFSIFNNFNNFYDYLYAIKDPSNILNYATVSIYQKF